MMRGKVLLPEDMSSAGKDYLAERGYDVVMGSGRDEASVIREIADCDAVIVREARISEAVLRAGKKLRVVAQHGVGINHIDVAKATELGIRVTNGPESNCAEVAEYAVAMILALAHNLPVYDREVRAGNWEIRRFFGVNITDKTAGIVGFGKIGRHLAQKLHGGFGMKILVLNSHISGVVPDCVELVDTLEELIARSDVLSLNCPSTPETVGLLSRERIALMKPTAFLVNCARGNLVDQEALVEALRQRRIRGAALDVFVENPLPPGHPLTRLENVLLTPHSAAHTQEAMDKMALYAAMGVDEVLSGKPVTWPVN